MALEQPFAQTLLYVSHILINFLYVKLFYYYKIVYNLHCTCLHFFFILFYYFVQVVYGRLR